MSTNSVGVLSGPKPPACRGERRQIGSRRCCALLSGIQSAMRNACALEAGRRCTTHRERHARGLTRAAPEWRTQAQRTHPEPPRRPPSGRPSPTITNGRHWPADNPALPATVPRPDVTHTPTTNAPSHQAPHTTHYPPHQTTTQNTRTPHDMICTHTHTYKYKDKDKVKYTYTYTDTDTLTYAYTYMHTPHTKHSAPSNMHQARHTTDFCGEPALATVHA